MGLRATLLVAALLLPALASAPALGQPGGSEDPVATQLTLRPTVTVNAAAVAQTPEGLVGSVATISISVATNGSGHIFIDTVPLTQVDMQGSARLAVKIASRVAGVNPDEHDFFFVVRSNSQIIGGPSAGGIMTVGTIAALKGWSVNRSIMLTGTINPDGSIGPVGGVPEKAFAASEVGASYFLFPEGQETSVANGRVVDVADYCRDALRITCVPVRDAEEATRIITGHEFVTPPLEGNVTNERYREVLAPLARGAEASAASSLSSARDNLTASRVVPASVRTELRASLARADASLGEARGAIAEESYYTAISKTFQTSIEARYVDAAVALFESPDSEAYTTTLLGSAAAAVKSAVDLARAATATDETSIQAIGTAQARATEAEDLLADARAGFASATGVSGTLGALYNAAFAVERARTVYWWLAIGEEFGAPGATVSRARLAELSREGIETADEIVTYSEVVLQESGAPPTAVAEARGMLEGARRDHEAGFYAAALFQALQAEVRGGLALELLGYSNGVPGARIDRAEEDAARAILEAREHGFEPLLAISYYEFAGSNRDPEDVLSYYHLARTVARLGEFVRAEPSEPRGSRFIGDAAVPRATGVVPGTHAFGYLAVGLAGGASLALLLTVLIPRRDARPPPALFRGGPPPPYLPENPPAPPASPLARPASPGDGWATPIAPAAPPEPASPTDPPSEPWVPRGP